MQPWCCSADSHPTNPTTLVPQFSFEANELAGISQGWYHDGIIIIQANLDILQVFALSTKQDDAIGRHGQSSGLPLEDLDCRYDGLQKSQLPRSLIQS
jgi:hypothetical protein